MPIAKTRKQKMYSSLLSSSEGDLRPTAEDRNTAFQEKCVSVCCSSRVTSHAAVGAWFQDRRSSVAFANWEASSAVDIGLHHQISKKGLKDSHSSKGNNCRVGRRAGIRGQSAAEFQKTELIEHRGYCHIITTVMYLLQAAAADQASPQAAAIWGRYSASAEPQANLLIPWASGE